MTKKPFSFEIDKTAIEALAKVLQDADLTEIEYEDQGRRVRLTRSQPVAAISAVSAPAPVAAPAPVQAASSTVVASQSAAETSAPHQHPGAVKSPMVGTVYLAPEPGAAPFVNVGSKVNKGDTVCIVEAMKVMNPIKATASGVVKQLFMTDATPVEFGEVLLIIE